MRSSARSISVSLAHRCWNSAWDADRNAAAYGELASIDGVGSNLRVRIKCALERDLQLGLALTKRLLDHRALFTDEPQFHRDPSTLEAITVWLRVRLRRELPSLIEVVTHDGPHLACRAEARLDTIACVERVGNIWLTQTVSFCRRTGLGVSRGEAKRAMAEVAPAFAGRWPGDFEAWGRALFDQIELRLPDLTEMNIDCGARGILRVSGLISAATSVSLDFDPRPQPQGEFRCSSIGASSP